MSQSARNHLIALLSHLDEIVDVQKIGMPEIGLISECIGITLVEEACARQTRFFIVLKFEFGVVVEAAKRGGDVIHFDGSCEFHLQDASSFEFFYRILSEFYDGGIDLKTDSLMPLFV